MQARAEQVVGLLAIADLFLEFGQDVSVEEPKEGAVGLQWGHFVAGDSFLPRWLTKRGHRLVFSNGIVVLAVVAVAPLVATGGTVNALNLRRRCQARASPIWATCSIADARSAPPANTSSAATILGRDRQRAPVPRPRRLCPVHRNRPHPGLFRAQRRAGAAHRGGNRTLHMIAVTQARGIGPGQAYLDKLTTALTSGWFMPLLSHAAGG